MLYNVLKYDVVDDEIEKVVLYYESVSQDIGIRFETEVEKALDKLETKAEYFFYLQDKKHRRIPIEGFPYSLIYCIEGQRVIVKMLIPQKDDPAKLWDQLGLI